MSVNVESTTRWLGQWKPGWSQLQDIRTRGHKRPDQGEQRAMAQAKMPEQGGHALVNSWPREDRVSLCGPSHPGRAAGLAVSPCGYRQLLWMEYSRVDNSEGPSPAGGLLPWGRKPFPVGTPGLACRAGPSDLGSGLWHLQAGRGCCGCLGDDRREGLAQQGPLHMAAVTVLCPSRSRPPSVSTSFPARGPRGDSVPCLLQRLVLQAFLGLWLSPSNLCLHMASPPPASSLLSLTRTLVIGFGPPPQIIQGDLI